MLVLVKILQSEINLEINAKRLAARPIANVLSMKLAFELTLFQYE